MRLFALFFVTTLLSQLVSAKKPSILFILTDDQALGTISGMGNKDISTPNIDHLMKRGSTFTNASNMGSWGGGICAPSRTMMFTSRFLWNARKARRADYEHPLLTKVFKEAGYDTYGTGKWHVETTGKMADAFDHLLNQSPDEITLSKEDLTGFTPWDQSFGGFWGGDRHITDITGDSAIKLLEQASAQRKPFFLYVVFNAPSSVFQFEEKETNRFKIEEFRLPPNIMEKHFFITNKCPEEITPKFVRKRYGDFFTMIEHLDQQVGRLLDTLKKSGQEENTIVTFLSDSGLSIGENGIMGNLNLYKKSLKAPLILAGPGVPSNKFNDTLVYLQDVMPTLMNLAQVEVPKFCEFRSFLPQMTESEESRWKDIYGTYMGFMRSIRLDDYKLVVYSGKDRNLMRLNDLFEDPFEMNDLSEQAKMKPLIDDLLRRLQRWENFSGSKMNIRDRFFKSAN
ncbi:sulfatase-like hydrolase/transferase [bacterium]|nr:sulfatase-like hydrolase/transferase [bacterium]